MSESSRNPFVEALQAGLSPIPVDTSTKRPLVAWKTFQSEPAELVQCQEWDAAGHNIGIVTGQVSGRLICLDFEGAFGGYNELHAAMISAGVGDVFASWCEGYLESTPSGGRHVLVRLEGSGPLQGNTKLASDADGKTLIETRGEGGYVIIAPSRNGDRGWRLISGSVAEIGYATSAESETVMAVLTTFDYGLAAPPPRVEPRGSGMPSILRLGSSWIEEALESLPTMERMLGDLGWTQVGRDAYGTHWVRPGKDPREGHSASVSHESHRLWVHSTNAGLPTNVSMDVCDLIFCCDGRPLPSLDERTTYLRNWWDKLPRNVLGDEVERFLGAQRPAAALDAGADTAVSAVDSLHLGDDFWQSRPVLEAVYSAARGRMISPDAVLGAFLSSYAATIPMGIWVPAVVSARAPLNIFSCLVGASGTGKTGSIHAALDLIGPVANPDVLLARSLRSGEGLINLAIKPRAKGSDLTEPPSFRNAVQITFDEGAALARQSDRSGSTTIPYLNTAWAGLGVVGGAKAGEQGFFPADLVRVCCVMGVQFGAAANLFTGETAALGFPQRLLFHGLRSPDMANLDVDLMDAGPIRQLSLPIYEVTDFVRTPRFMEVPADIAREVRLWTQNKDHGSGISDPLDGHRMNLRLRVASVLALLDERFLINGEDWVLASQVETVSRSIRSALLRSLGDVTAERAKAAGRGDAVRRIEEGNVYIERAALSLARKVHRWPGPVHAQLAKSHLRPYKQRHGVHWRTAAELAEQRQWVVIHKNGDLAPGPVNPGGSGGS